MISLGLGYWYGMPKEGSGGGNGGGGKKEPKFLKQGLVAYYPFNGNVKDESGNGNDGEVTGATLCTNRFGKSDSAFAFDSKDFVRVNNSFGKSLTIASWGLLPTTNPSKPSILWYFGGNSLPINLMFYNGKIFLNTHDSQDNPFATYTAKSDTWTHYVTVISPDRTELFIDGEKLGQAQYRQHSEQPFYIGMNGGYPWIGQIDDIRIYNRALSEAK